LTPLAKVASAGASLALATAALFVLAGCGGSDPEPSEGSSAAATVEGADSQDEGGEGSGQGSPRTSSQGGAGSSGASPDSTADSQNQRLAIPEGPREQAPTAAQQAGATLATIVLQSPAIRSPSPESIGALPAAHTCDGADSWPALQWRGIPSGSAELVLFAMNTEPVGGEIFFDWALAGLDPSLGGIEAARLPSGAILGQNSFGERGYSICPPAGKETYMFALYALPKRLSPPRGFDPGALRKEILALSASVGFLPATYSRG
jgi:phosphatidylethanolamine-binding protein (PEBP) family uncharacterized protein